MRIAVIISFRGNSQLLEWTLEGFQNQTLGQGHSLAVHVGLDGEALPAINLHGATARAYPRMGAAAVRNALIKEAGDADLLIFGNADARPEPDMVQRHADAIAGTPEGSMVLGAAPWETPGTPTVWDLLLAHTPMIFFYSQLEAGGWYGFRQAWTLNLSMRRSDFAACGGFPEQLRPVYYEDLALGYRLLGKERKGILYEPRARVLHRHPTTIDQYFDREELLGIMSPVLARQCAGAFGILHGTRDVESLHHTFRDWIKVDAPMHRWIYQRLSDWQRVPAAGIPEGDVRQQLLMSLYQMQVPLKRLAFRLGFLKGMKLAEDSHWQERKPAGLWRTAIGIPVPSA